MPKSTSTPTRNAAVTKYVTPQWGDCRSDNTEFDQLLDLLGYRPEDRTSICSLAAGGKFEHREPSSRAATVGLATSPGHRERDVWFAVNPVAIPKGHTGRGGDEHVTRCVALYADIDVKAGGVTDPEVAEKVAIAISTALGVQPVAVVFSGHGGHAYWLLDANDDAWTLKGNKAKRAAAQAVYRRVHRLCAEVAERHGCGIDNVAQLSRILRVPGTVNYKDPANPVEVCLTVHPYGPPSAPLTYEQVCAALDAHGITERPDDREVTGEKVSDPKGWEFGESTHPYVAAMVAGWPNDVVKGSRHSWLVAQATRLQCARRLGSITDDDYDDAIQMLHDSFLAKLMDGGEPRQPSPSTEVEDALAWGADRAARMSDADAADDLGVDLDGGLQLLGTSLVPAKSRELVAVPTDTAALAQLTGVDPSALESEALRRQVQLTGDKLARARIAAMEVADLDLPPIMSLDELLAIEDEPEVLRIGGVWPAGGAKVMCAAKAGHGKTTLSGNLVRSLADGVPFLDAFPVNQRAQRIVIIDNEMTTVMLKSWMRSQGIVNTSVVVDVVTLRGQAGLFDMGNDRVRDMWSRRLRDVGCDFVIFDCVKPVLEAMRLDENHEMGKFLYPFHEMLTTADVHDVLVHHHMGHTGERARGDSSALGWTDANWEIVPGEGDQAGLRFFRAPKVRGADEPLTEGLLSFDPVTKHLTYAGGTRSQTKGKATVEERMTAILNAVADAHAERTEELTATAIQKAVGGKKDITDEARALAVERELLEMRHQGRSRLYKLTQKAWDPLYMGERREPAIPA